MSFNISMSETGTVEEFCGRIRNISVLEQRAPRFICDAMKLHRQDVSVQKCATIAIAAMGEKKKNFADINDSGFLSELATVWALHIRNESFVKDILVTLRTLSANEDLRLAVVTSNANDLLVQTMTEYKDRESVQLHALALFVNLSFGSDYVKKRIFATGGLKSIVSALRTYNSARHVKLQAKGCAAIRNLSIGFGEGEADDFTEGGIECLTHAITNFRYSKDVSNQALSALINIAFSHRAILAPPEKHEEIIRTVTALVTRTTGSFRNNLDSHSLVFKLLRTMALDCASVQDAASRFGCVQAIISLLRVYVTDLGVSAQTTPYYTVITQAISALRCLTHSQVFREGIMKHENGMEVLIKCAYICRDDAGQIEHAVLALGNTLFDNANAKSIFFNLKGMQVLINVMNKHIASPAIQEACCLAIRAACDGCSENQRAALQLDCQLSCLALVKNFRDNVVLLEQAFAVLLIMVQSNEPLSDKDAVCAMQGVNEAVATFPYSTLLKAQRSLLIKTLNCSSEIVEESMGQSKFRDAIHRGLRRFGSRA